MISSSAPSVSLIGGLRAGGMNASRGLTRLTIAGESITIAPRWTWQRWFHPRLCFSSSTVTRLVVVGIVARLPLGVRFELDGAPEIEDGLQLWRSLVGRRVRRPIVWLAAGDITRVLEALPTIEQAQARGFLWWP